MKTPPTQGRVFISYSHQDRDLVDHLASALHKRGVDIFFDKWDIAPGDSLVRRIFSDGLGNCRMFLIVLSRSSTRSSWVQEELDAALVRRIEGVTRVIPVLKEDCEIPMSLRATRWIDLRSDFDQGVQELVNCYYGVASRPPPGLPPAYESELVLKNYGISRGAATCGLALIRLEGEDEGRQRYVPASELLELTRLNPQEINDAIDELEEQGTVKTSKTLGTHPFHFAHALPTYALFLKFSDVLSYDPMNDIKIAVAAVAALNQAENKDLAQKTSLSPGRLNRAIEYMDDYGLARVSRTLGTSPFTFRWVTATSATRRTASEL